MSELMRNPFRRSARLLRSAVVSRAGILCVPCMLLVAAFLCGQSVFAQSSNPNIATSAVATHSGGGSGNYAPDQYNNGVITADPTGCPGTAPYPWGWTSTGDGQNGTNYWIQFDWPSPQTFGEFTFYHAYTCRRQLGGGDIQAWIGNTWVTVHSFTFQSPWTIPMRTTSFTPVTTDRVRITNMLIVGNAGQQISNPAFREIEIRNTITGPNDAGIASIDSPKDFCAGQHDIIVTLHNFGTNQLTAATINWTLNGAPQSAYNWSGLLDTLNGPSRQTQITLGSDNFQSGVPYTITVWTSMPNGVADTINMNDTASVTAQAAIAGTFTIGGATPDYPTFTDAVDDLNSFGLCGPVVFNVRPGTYNERIALEEITGSSSINTVTFQSETGNRADVNLTYNATGSANNGVITLSGATFVTFREITVTAQSASYGQAVVIDGTATDNSFVGCELISQVVSTTSTNVAVVYSPSGSMNHRHTFDNCGIRGGSYGMYLYGSGSTSTEDGLVVSDCEFTDQYYMAYRGYYCGEVTFVDNFVHINSSYSSKYLAQFYYGYNTSIERNIFISEGGTYGYGIYIYYDGYYQTGNSRFVNNMVSVLNTTSTTYGVRPYNNENMFFAHNTVHVNGSSTSSRAVYTYSGASSTYLNNIMYHSGAGVAWYVSSPAAIIESDYNVFYSNGSNLAYWSGNRTDLAALQAASGMDANSVSKTVFFENTTTGDLHLTGASEDDTDLFGTLLKEVTIDIDHQERVNPYIGADEACYVLPGSLTYEFVDGAGMPAGYAEVPGTIGIKYGVTFPEFASTVTFTVQFLDPVTNQLVYQTIFSAAKQYGVPLSGVHYITLPTSVPAGAYKIEVHFNTKNSCDAYSDYMPYASALLLVPEGRIPCVVWPGDVNNDGVVNYTDRRALNTYIYDANLRTSWLNGPARYQADVETNPFTYLEWKPQAGAPWQTPEGCYMDTDGNGVVNNLDYIAMKLNWSKMTPWYGGSPKHDLSAPSGFMMDQNYPNPFNPTTVIRYSVPEVSEMRLVVTDALGRIVAEQELSRVEKGMHEYSFDGSQLSSGMYVATMTMTGIGTGVTYTKTIKMALMR